MSDESKENVHYVKELTESVEELKKKMGIVLEIVQPKDVDLHMNLREKIVDLEKKLPLLEQYQKVDNGFIRNHGRDINDLKIAIRVLSETQDDINSNKKDNAFEINKLKEEFECHFRADKDYDLKYKNQFEVLRNKIGETATACGHNNRVMKEMTFPRFLKIVADYAELKENINIIADNSGIFEDMLLTKTNKNREVLRDLINELPYSEDRKRLLEKFNEKTEKKDCGECDLWGECDHQGAYQINGKWCYESSDDEKSEFVKHVENFQESLDVRSKPAEVIKKGDNIEVNKITGVVVGKYIPADMADLDELERRTPLIMPQILKDLMKNDEVRRYIKNTYIDGHNDGIKRGKVIEREDNSKRYSNIDGILHLDKLMKKYFPDYEIVKREVLQFLIETANVGCEELYDWDGGEYKKFRRIKEEYRFE